jgi:hypothetical protein
MLEPETSNRYFFVLKNNSYDEPTAEQQTTI